MLLLHGIIDDHLLLLEAAALDPAKGNESLALPAPPPHLAQIWHGATAARNGSAPAAPQPAALQLDVGLLSSSPERCALETGYPIMAEAIMTRWGKPGLANYLSNLIRATNENHGPSMTVETIGELIMLHDVAREIGDAEAGLSVG